VGFTPLVGDIATRLDNGWHVRFGAGYDFSSHFSASLEYTYHGLGVSEGVLNEARVPDGSAHLWSLTVDPKLRLKAHGKYVPYLVGGVGFYRRTIEFTQPTLVPVLFIDPFFGTVFNTLVPANQVLGDIRRSGIGGSLGAGFDRKLLDSHVKFFAEARYHYAATGRIPVRMIPLTVGLRW
jgi:opacity protein-like surface antigen